MGGIQIDDRVIGKAKRSVRGQKGKGKKDTPPLESKSNVMEMK